MRAWLVAVALLGIVTAAHAEAIDSVGAGLTSCASFAKKYKANRKFTEEFYFTWAEGFLTGLNAAADAASAAAITCWSTTGRFGRCVIVPLSPTATFWGRARLVGLAPFLPSSREKRVLL